MGGIIILCAVFILGQYLCSKIDEWRLKRWKRRYKMEHKVNRNYHPNTDLKKKYASGFKVKDIPYRGKYNDIY